MYGIALALLSFGAAEDPVKLPSTVSVIKSRRFEMPVLLNDEWRSKIKQLRLFVSDDGGKSWNHVDDFEASAKRMTYEAPEDGLYLFAIQIMFKDGKSDPADLKNLNAEKKVFINSSGKPVSVQKPYAELLRENEELRRRIEDLEKKLGERTSNPKPR